MRLGRLKKDSKGEGRTGATTGWTTINDSDECVLGLGGGGGAEGAAAGQTKDDKTAVHKTAVTSMAASSMTAVNDIV